MSKHRGVLRGGLIALVAIGLVACPRVGGGFGSLGGTHAQGDDHFPFTPDVATLEVEGTPGGEPGFLFPPGYALTPVPPTPLPPGQDGLVVIGGEYYLIGDERSGTGGLRLGSPESDPFGLVGYATLLDAPAYRLIWYTDPQGVRHNMIVHGDDSLFSGPDGFQAQLTQYLAGFRTMSNSAGGMIGGGILYGALVAGGCTSGGPPGCVVALVSSLVAAGGGLASAVWHGVTEVLREYGHIILSFMTIDTNRGRPR
jgi:hypothetical protein